MVGGGPFDLKAGEWTDDTTMALCLAESLVEVGFDEKHQLETYCRWWKEGHLSVKGRCFDIGNKTRHSLEAFDRKRKFVPMPDDDDAGNGSIMRLAPVPLKYAGNLTLAAKYSALSSRTTHGAREAVGACCYLGVLIASAVRGAHKSELLSKQMLSKAWRMKGAPPKIADIVNGSFKDKQPPEVRGGGYVVACLEAALWAFYRSDDFRTGALLAANLGDDADTTAAVYGQLAGAHYGEEAIPQEWRDKLAMRGLIERRADELFALATKVK